MNRKTHAPFISRFKRCASSIAERKASSRQPDGRKNPVPSSGANLKGAFAI